MALLGIKSAAFHLGLSKDCLRQWRRFFYIETYPPNTRNSIVTFDSAALLWLLILKRAGISWMSGETVDVAWTDERGPFSLGRIGAKRPGVVGEILEKLREWDPATPLWLHIKRREPPINGCFFSQKGQEEMAALLETSKFNLFSIDIKEIWDQTPWLGPDEENGEGGLIEPDSKPQLKHSYFRIGKKHRLVISIGVRVEELTAKIIP